MSIVIPGSLGLAKNILSPKSASGFETNDVQVLNNDGIENFIRFSKCIADPTLNGWVRYQNTAQSTPVTGTGGTPSSNVTFTRTTTGNLDTNFGSFIITKAAVNMQGYGVSYNITIPPKYKSQQLVVSFYFATSVSYVSGDIAFFVYDVTNSALVSPAGGLGIGTSTNVGTQGTFTLTGSTSYRVIFHIATVNAAAYTLELDNIHFGPGSVTNLSATAPLTYNSATTVLAIPKATTGVDGYLAAADFTTFNNKVATTRNINTTAPITGGGDLSADRTIAMAASTNAVDGYLTAADHTTFAAKVSTTRAINTTAPITGGGDLSADRTIAIAASTNAVDGYLTATDHTTFAAKQAAITVGSLGAGNANGLDLTTGTLTLHAGTSTQPGAVTTAAQTIAGAKTFNADILKPAISGNASFRSLITPTGAYQSVTNLQVCTATFGDSANTGFLFTITSSINKDSALLFATFAGAGISAVANADSLFLPTDAGTGIYVTKSAATGVISFKNRTGFTATIGINAINCTVTGIGAWA